MAPSYVQPRTTKPPLRAKLRATDFLRKNRRLTRSWPDSTYPIVRLKENGGDGKQINIPLVTQLSGSGVGAPVRAATKEIDSYGFRFGPTGPRNAVATTERSPRVVVFRFDPRLSLLSGWSRRIVRDDLGRFPLSIPTAAIQSNRLASPGTGSTASNGPRQPLAIRIRGLPQPTTASCLGRRSATTPRRFCHRCCQRGLD